MPPCERRMADYADAQSALRAESASNAGRQHGGDRHRIDNGVCRKRQRGFAPQGVLGDLVRMDARWLRLLHVRLYSVGALTELLPASGIEASRANIGLYGGL